MKIILYIIITTIILVQGCNNDKKNNFNPQTDTLLTNCNIISLKKYLKYNLYFDTCGNVFEKEIFDSKRYIYSTTIFYKNNKVMLKGQKATYLKIPFGIWSYYSTTGALLKQVNWDTLYNISVCKAFVIANENGFKTDSIEISFSKDSSNNEYWNIGQDNSKEYETGASTDYSGITINCKTGNFKRESSGSELHALRPYKYNDTVYYKVDKLPEFPGGNTKRLEFIKNNIDYSKTKKLNKMVQVIIYFICKKDGTLSDFYIDKAPVPYDIEINEKIEQLYKDEALRIIKKFPKLIAGTFNGKNVNTMTSFTIELENRYY